jgi:hypothetical protein
MAKPKIKPKPKPLPKAVAKPAKPRAAAAPAAGKLYRVRADAHVIRLSDGACIPPSEDNADFRAFVAAVEADPSIVAH